jgi:hypothetical protein
LFGTGPVGAETTQGDTNPGSDLTFYVGLLTVEPGASVGQPYAIGAAVVRYLSTGSGVILTTAGGFGDGSVGMAGISAGPELGPGQTAAMYPRGGVALENFGTFTTTALIFGVVPSGGPVLMELGEDGVGREEAVYESPTHGYTLTYDPWTWELLIENVNPYDWAYFANGVSSISLNAPINYDADEMAGCAEVFATIEGELGVSGVEPLGEPGAEGEQGDRAWATYAFTLESEDGEERDLVRYAECRWLGDGVTLAVVHQTPADAYAGEVEAREDFLSGFEPAGGEEHEAEHDDRG